MDPISLPAVSPRLKLRLLICNARSIGMRKIQMKGCGGNIPVTSQDKYLPQFFSYECKTQTEWQSIALYIARQVNNQNCLFAHAHFVDLSKPVGPAARVDLVALGLYYPLAVNGAKAGSIPQEGATPTPATISDLAPSLEEAGQMPVSPQTDEGEQSGAAGEAACLPESTFSTAEETDVPTPEGSGDTLVSPDTGEDTDTAASAVPDAAGEQRGPVKAGKSAPAPPKRKPGRPAKK